MSLDIYSTFFSQRCLNFLAARLAWQTCLKTMSCLQRSKVTGCCLHKLFLTSSGTKIYSYAYMAGSFCAFLILPSGVLNTFRASCSIHKTFLHSVKFHIEVDAIIGAHFRMPTPHRLKASCEAVRFHPLKDIIS